MSLERTFCSSVPHSFRLAELGGRKGEGEGVRGERGKGGGEGGGEGRKEGGREGERKTLQPQCWRQ